MADTSSKDKGLENYKVWSIRAKAVLIQDNTLYNTGNKTNIPLNGITQEGIFNTVNILDYSQLKRHIKSLYKAIGKSNIINTVKEAPNGDFAIDSGATIHTTCNRDYYTTYRPINKVVKWGKASCLTVKGQGTIRFQYKTTGIIEVLENVLYIPE